ncbi:hypothetical protein OENI_110013 [Oenococcus oeni]|nr:hypothetical protein OENI_110013 [Oenococcus oeni]SYW09805.1 hypothetical protein OENI_100073 [Oenococcus oeni]SYW11118.1 hypothetical protein OENI_10225 [Oenococcus oeni]
MLNGIRQYTAKADILSVAHRVDEICETFARTKTLGGLIWLQFQ